MKNSSLLIWLSCCLLISCSSDNSIDEPNPLPPPEPVKNTSPKIKTISTGTETITYTYDQYGRIKSKVNTNGDKDEFTFTYQMVTVNKKFGSQTSIVKHELNSDGNAIRVTSSSSPSSETIIEYDAGKYQATNRYFGPVPLLVKFFISGGNCDSTWYCEPDGTWKYTHVQTFYNDPVVNMGEYEGLMFWGKWNKNMLKSSYMRTNNSPVIQLVNYSYEYNPAGLLTKEIRTENGNSRTITYTYY